MQMSPYLQMMLMQQQQSQNPFSSPMGGSAPSNAAPQIPIQQPRQSNILQSPMQPQMMQPQQGGGLGGLVNAGQNVQKLYGMGNSMFGSNTPSTGSTGGGSPQASTTGLTPNYQQAPMSPQLNALQNTPVTQASMGGNVQQSNELFPSNATQQAWQQSQQPWYNNIFGGGSGGGAAAGAANGQSGGMFGQMGANGMVPTAGSGGFFNGMNAAYPGAGAMAQPGLATPGASGVGEGGTSSMFGSAGASGAGAAADNPSWLQSLWAML